MACIQASPNVRHANLRRSNGSCTESHAPAAHLWLRALLVGLALILSAGQVFAADPATDPGGVLDEAVRSQTLIELSQGASDDAASEASFDAFERQAAMKTAGGDSARKVIKVPQIDEYVMCVTCFTTV